MASANNKVDDTDVMAASVNDPELIAKTLSQGFPWLRFPPTLEAAYDRDRHRRLLPRAIAIGWYALGIYLTYSLSDYWLLPESVHQYTIAIRLLVVFPVICYLIWGSYQSWSAQTYLRLYVFAYFIGGLSVIAIILIARLQRVPIPYEGLVVTMMFGYLLLALPFYHVLLVSSLLLVIYIFAELFAGYPPGLLVFNCFFLLTANVIGAVGCYLQEQAQRRNYLNQCLVEISRDSAQEQSDAKTLLLATASHDLRQPLHAMTLFAENLEQNLPEGEQKNTARNLQASMQQLNQLLGSLLDISRLQVGVVEPQCRHFDPGPLLRQLVLEGQREGGCKLELNDNGPGKQSVFSDPVLFTRIIRNLIENAIEHAEATIVSVKLITQGDQVVVSVSDNGKGIPATELDNIFEEFHQLNANTKSGLGLGLAIVKQMANLLHVDLQVNSTEGKGTEFMICLPKGESLDSTQLQAVPHTESSIEAGRILMAEDSPDILSSASALVCSWGYQVDCAASVSQAMDLVAVNRYHAVISDYHFQEEETGESLVRRLRKQHYDLPVMILTADTHVQLDDPDLMPLQVCYKPLKPARFRMILNYLLSGASRPPSTAPADP